jgi:transposase
MCREAGVYLPPYFLDLNTIEEFFIKLKAFITKQWHKHKKQPTSRL